MACCRLAAHHPPCSSAATCSIGDCGRMGTSTDLPTLPLSTLPVPPRLDAPAAAGPLASPAPVSDRSLPQARPERPPRA
jgi:hypothetical protein